MHDLHEDEIPDSMKKFVAHVAGVFSMLLLILSFGIVFVFIKNVEGNIGYTVIMIFVYCSISYMLFSVSKHLIKNVDDYYKHTNTKGLLLPRFVYLLLFFIFTSLGLFLTYFYNSAITSPITNVIESIDIIVPLVSCFILSFACYWVWSRK